MCEQLRSGAQGLGPRVWGFSEGFVFLLSVVASFWGELRGGDPVQELTV